MPNGENRPFAHFFCAPPVTEANLPHITPAMIVDEFEEEERIVFVAASSRRVFRWFLVIDSSKDNLRLQGSFDMPDAHLLLVLRARDAVRVLPQHVSSFALVELEEHDDPSALEPFRDRIIAVQTNGADSPVIWRTYALFSRLLAWESELERIMLKQGTLTEMLDAGATLLNNFIFVSDNDFGVIARTSTVEPPDKLHRSIIDAGCLTPSTIAEKRFRLPEKTFYTRAASDITPYDRVSCPIHVNHSYFGSVSMSCNVRPDTDGLRDEFRTFIKHLTPLCEKIWMRQAQANIPSYFFFSNLIEHKEMASAYLESQLDAIGLSGMRRFKLVLIDVDKSCDPERAAFVIKAASTLNEGASFSFPYQDHVLAVLYSAHELGRLSHPRTSVELTEKIFRAYGALSCVSSVFGDITDLDLAYRQTQIALKFKKPVDRELMAGSGVGRGVYLFEEALSYHLLEEAAPDERFAAFLFSCSIAGVLYEEDIENGTNYFSLIWLYLQSERSATAVANRMHLHRNTVLYHVEKIQKRFGFDLDSKTARDWVVLSYKRLFLTMDESAFKRAIDTGTKE